MSKTDFSMDNYKLVRKRADPTKEDDVLRVSTKSSVGSCISRVIQWFTRDKQETIHITSTGNAIPNAISVVEIVKHRVEGLHQVNCITSLKTLDEYEPLKEGLDHVQIERFLC